MALRIKDGKVVSITPPKTLTTKNGRCSNK